MTPSLDGVCVATDIALAELWRTEAQPWQQELQQSALAAAGPQARMCAAAFP